MAQYAAEKERILKQLAELSEGDPEDHRLRVVQLDGLAALKIIKHAKDNLPYLVTGQLLGLDFGAKLEVSDCFPFPNNSSAETDEAAEADSVEYQWEMMKCLREVNTDNNTVGWYQSAYLGSFLNEDADFISTQYSYQTTIPKCVALIYDPLRTKQGALSIKAYRLTSSFMELFKAQTFTQEALTKLGLSFNDIVEEIPVTIHNSSLSNAMLYELEESKSVGGLDFERLDLSANPFLERNLDSLIEYIDDLVAEQNKYQYWQRTVQRQEAQKAAYAKKKKADEAGQGRKDASEPAEDINQLFKPITQPSRLESLLITNQINNYCQQINQFAGQGFSKLYMVAGLHRDGGDHHHTSGGK